MDEIRAALLSLHRSLIDFERGAYEKARGRTSSGEFLQALVRDPSFNWLAPLTSQIARLDELADMGETATEATTRRRTWRARTRSLLRGSEYARRVESSPDVAFAHAAALHALTH
jgi:hypothetical protein